MTRRLDISAFDDTELGAELRAAYVSGARMVTLVDSSEPDERAATWVDGSHGLYKLRCSNDHVWLSALGRFGIDYKQPTCTICGLMGSGVGDVVA